MDTELGFIESFSEVSRQLCGACEWIRVGGQLRPGVRLLDEEEEEEQQFLQIAEHYGLHEQTFPCIE